MMSSDAASSFLERLKDPSFDNQCQEAITAASLDAMVAIGAQHGLEFTTDELAQHLKDQAAELESEIGEDELEAVAGGIIGDTGRKMQRTGASGMLMLTLRASLQSSACPPSRHRG
jgi:predicted ribosomally synthesized peptide with nif11-like leader